MTDFFNTLLRSILAYLPFAILLWLDSAVNVKRKDRSLQFALPLLALIYCTVLMVKVNDLAIGIGERLTTLPQVLAGLPVLSLLASPLERLISAVDTELLLFYTLNAGILLGYILLKLISLPLMRGLCGAAGELADAARGICYEHDPMRGAWLLKKNCAQGRAFLKAMFLAATGISFAVGRIAVALYLERELSAVFYPVFGVIVIGEMYFFANGLSPDEYEEDAAAEGEKPLRFCNYAPLRGVFRRLFPDKIAAENTSMGTSALDVTEEGSGLYGRARTGDAVADAYYACMAKQQRAGLKIDTGYLDSGLKLAEGRSVLFNNPFYYDLIPYAFYAMNRNLLRHKKILVVLGRHGVEGDIAPWLDKGLSAVTNIPGMWRIGVLTDKEQELDVGIVTRSGVHELALHEKNEDFFSEAGMVVLIEPSRLLTTAQVGLNSILRRCGRKDVTYCSTDRNCDGLVDALSHLLMTDITEVSATNRHEGTCSYMCWETDGENLQHRLLPNISRYLGVGTELSFVALKNQVEKTVWYGGEVFPVRDMHWIVKQYYYDLLHYADLPTTQDELDRRFAVSYNTWNAPVQENGYFVVEDEGRNMFEIKREFATRATGQSFINIISPQYLLHDYMAANEGLFNTDPKAVPTIVADYAGTQRNVALRLFLRMSLGDITKRELSNELQLIGVGGEDPVEEAWKLLCRLGQTDENEKSAGELILTRNGDRFTFRQKEAIGVVRKYSIRSGEIDDFVQIIDSTFRDVLLGDLKSARYVSEEEGGEQKYLGSELNGHIFQRYLPGQFFTFEGKYYEMLRMTPDGRVVLRRAAEHITGRSFYRQIRRYSIHYAETAADMGACRTVGGMRITRQFADLSVETPGYWQMRSYQDFASAKKVELNGVPTRMYYHKQILRVELTADGEPLDDRRCETLTLLLNEVFRTLFSENSEYIAALCGGEFEQPMTYSLMGADGFEPSQGCIYFVEDSQLDLGLLIAVERNLQRIFEIVCDYLDWHTEALKMSMEAPLPAPAAKGEAPEIGGGTERNEAEPAPQRENAGRPGLFGRLKAWWAKHFGKKAAPASENEIAEDEDLKEPAAETEMTGGADAAPEMPEEVTAGGASGQEEIPEPDEEELVSCSVEGEQTEQRAENDVSDTGEAEEDSFEFETPEAAEPSLIPARKPYHERCYLYYGAAKVPEGLDIEGTLDFLRASGFGERELTQARHGKDVAARIEEGYRPNLPGVHYCDFCGVELTGTEHDVLKDGRESCVNCSRSAVRTEEDFRRIYRELVKNMEIFYDMHISVPVKIRMVNAQRLHKSIGKRFVPSAAQDPRVVGVAIRDRKGNYSILVENGAPRIRSTLTMAHELTHIWQYTNWDKAGIRNKYGQLELEVYEGMAKWSEIQYAYLIGEAGIARREEIITSLREDEYGRGFLKYAAKYPISPYTHLEGPTPFDDRTSPL